MLAFASGLGLGLSLIVAIGAQNVFVLRQGIRREYVLTVVLVCALSDAALIAAGVAGLGALVQSTPWLIVVARWAGGILLVGYGLLAARRAWAGTGQGLQVDDGMALTLVIDQESAPPPAAETGPDAPPTRRLSKLLPRSGPRTTRSGAGGVILTTLALTWLNPHVYLDTVLLIGSIASTYGAARWVFGAGAMVASLLWFVALGFGAGYLGRWLRTPRAWRVLDAIIAVIMIVLGVGLVIPAITG